MSVPFIFSGRGMVVVVNGKSFSIDTNNHKFPNLYEMIKNDCTESEIYDYLSANETIESYLEKSEGVEFKDNKIYVNGEVLHNVIVDRINDFRRMNLPFEHLLKFIEKLQKNPSYNSRNQLYGFLENKDLVICEDGDFLAYKAVTEEYMDKHSKKINNTPGTTVKMDRLLIDDNPASHCSAGLHVGAINYVQDFKSNTDKVVIVKVNPKDVVSVPNDHNCTKCRVCEYYVVKDAEGIMSSPLYTTSGEPYTSNDFDASFDFLYDEDDDYEYEYDNEDEDEDQDWELPPYIQL